MSEEHYVNIAALEPLFVPHDEPSRHRVRGEVDGQLRSRILAEGANAWLGEGGWVVSL